MTTPIYLVTPDGELVHERQVEWKRKPAAVLWQSRTFIRKEGAGDVFVEGLLFILPDYPGQTPRDSIAGEKLREAVSNGEKLLP